MSRLALQRPEQVVALHVSEWLEDLQAADLTSAEQAYVDELNRWRERTSAATGTSKRTAPRRLASLWATARSGCSPGSPTSGAAGAIPPVPLDDDLILTTATIYWVTGTMATSMRAYAAFAPAPRGKVAVPTGITAGREERPPPPREWIERNYADVHDVTTLERGGHFWAAETPGQFADRLHGFFAQHARF